MRSRESPPLERVVARRRRRCGRRRSGRRCRWRRRLTVSSPAPPLSQSLPCTPRMVSLPRPPKTRSLPGPPMSSSSPPKPWMRSLPPLPSMWSATFVPRRRSLPGPPLDRRGERGAGRDEGERRGGADGGLANVHAGLFLLSLGCAGSEDHPPRQPFASVALRESSRSVRSSVRAARARWPRARCGILRGHAPPRRRPRPHRRCSPSPARSWPQTVTGDAAAPTTSSARPGADRDQRPRRQRPHPRPRRQRPPQRRARATTRSPATPATTSSSAARATTRCSAARATTASAAARARTSSPAAWATTSSARATARSTTSPAGPGRDRVIADPQDDVAARLRGRPAWMTAPAGPVVLLVDDDAAIRRTVAAGPRARGLHGRPRLGRPRGAGGGRARAPGGRPARPRACPTSTASRSCAACARAATRCRSACSRRATRSTTACAACRPGADDYVVKPFAHAGGRRAAAGAAAPAPGRRGRGARRPATCASTRARAARGAASASSTSRAASSSCSSSSCAIPGEVLERRRLHEEVWGYTFDPGHQRRRRLRRLPAAQARGRRRAARAAHRARRRLRPAKLSGRAQPPWSPDARRRARPRRRAAGGGRRRLALRRLLRARGARRPPRAHRRALARRPRWRPSTTSCPTNDKRLDAVLSATGSSLRLLAGRRGPARHRRAAARAPAPAARAADLHVAAGGATAPTSRRCATRASAASRAWRSSRALASLEHRQAALDRRLLALGLIALLVAGAGVWLAADLVLRPLRRLRTVASSVAEDEDLDRRVPAGRPDRAALAGGELQRDARAPRALGRRPRRAPWRRRGASPPTPATSCARR